MMQPARMVGARRYTQEAREENEKKKHPGKRLGNTASPTSVMTDVYQK